MDLADPCSTSYLRDCHDRVMLSHTKICYNMQIYTKVLKDIWICPKLTIALAMLLAMSFAFGFDMNYGINYVLLFQTNSTFTKHSKYIFHLHFHPVIITPQFLDKPHRQGHLQQNKSSSCLQMKIHIPEI